MLIASPSILHAQQEKPLSRCDTLVCFPIDTAIEMGRIIKLYPLVVQELKTTEEIASQHELALLEIRPELIKREKEIEELTAKLNSETAKKQKARKSRLWWGIGGALAGALTYSILSK